MLFGVCVFACVLCWVVSCRVVSCHVVLCCMVLLFVECALFMLVVRVVCCVDF